MFNIIPLKIKLIVGFLIILIFVLAISVALIPQSQELPVPSLKPSPTAKPPYLEPDYTGPEPGSIFQTSTSESEELANISELNGQLLEKLPYTGNNFGLRYDGNGNRFIANFSSNTEQQGRAELLEFLKSNGIENADWLTNFTTEIQ